MIQKPNTSFCILRYYILRQSLLYFAFCNFWNNSNDKCFFSPDPVGAGVAIPEEAEQQRDAELSGAVYQLQFTKESQTSKERNVSRTNEECAVPLSTGTAKRSGKRKSQSDSDQGTSTVVSFTCHLLAELK